MNDYTRGTLRQQAEPEASHWLWKLAGGMLALFALAELGAWIAERLAS